MATAQLIDHTNYSTLLKESTAARSGSPDGDFYFNLTSNSFEIITREELANVDLGSGSEANPLTNYYGITLRAVYLFENLRRKLNETLRNYLRVSKGQYKEAGAYSFIYGNKPAGSDRTKIRGSGWNEYADSGSLLDRVYFGVRSLNAIGASSQPYYTLVSSLTESALQAATWHDFSRQGPIDESVQVFGSTANGDSGAGNFDYRSLYLVVRLRTFGQIYAETNSILNGVSTLAGFSAGFGIGEADNTQNDYAIADVYGGAKISPWTGMGLTHYASPQTKTGFNEGDGSFSWVLANTLGGTVQQCCAYLDALAIQDADIDSGSGTYNGRKGRLWYSRDASGRAVTSAGLFIDGLSTAEQQNLILTCDDATTRTYPFVPSIRIDVGTIAPTDSNAWYEMFYLNGAGNADFDTANAVTVNDYLGNPIKGTVADDVIGTIITRGYAYDTNTQAGLAAGIDKDAVIIVEGDGVAGQAISYFTITRDAVVPVTCAPTVELNA